jgi:hypothetical protein
MAYYPVLLGLDRSGSVHRRVTLVCEDLNSEKPPLVLADNIQFPIS